MQFENGWRGRIRTCDNRVQSTAPYHLATLHLEAGVGLEPTLTGFADPRLATWLSDQGDRWNSNPQRPGSQPGALPIELRPQEWGVAILAPHSSERSASVAQRFGLANRCNQPDSATAPLKN